jgi:hypothetical protein
VATETRHWAASFVGFQESSPHTDHQRRLKNADEHPLYAGMFDDLELDPKCHHADRRSRDRQKNYNRCLDAAQPGMFNVKVSACPLAE